MNGPPAWANTIKIIPKPLAISKVTFLDFEVDDVSSGLLPLYVLHLLKKFVMRKIFQISLTKVILS